MSKIITINIEADVLNEISCTKDTLNTLNFLLGLVSEEYLDPDNKESLKKLESTICVIQLLIDEKLEQIEKLIAKLWEGKVKNNMFSAKQKMI